MKSRDGFDDSYVALLAGLWAEMESMLGPHDVEDATSAEARERAGLAMESLLLELVLLSDTCDSLSRQGRMTPRQASMMGTLIADLRGALNFDPHGGTSIRASAGIVRAQDRLFDEVQRVLHEEELAQRRRVG